MKEVDIIGLIQTVWKERIKVIKWGSIGLIVGLIIWVSSPNLYTSSTIIAPENNSDNAQKSSLGAMAGILGANISGGSVDGINEKLYPQIFKSSPFLLDIAEMKVEYENDSIFLYEYVLFHQKHAWWYYIPRPLAIFSSRPEEAFWKSKSQQASYVYLLSQMIDITTVKTDGVIIIKSIMQDPKIAMHATDALYKTLQIYITQYRTLKTKVDLDQQEIMLQNAKSDYYATDSVYAQIVDRNRNLNTQSAALKLDRAKNERDIAYSVYSQLATQVESQKIKLQQQTPIATIIEPVTTPFRPSSPRTMMLLVAMTFLGCFLSSAVIVVKALLRK